MPLLQSGRRRQPTAVPPNDEQATRRILSPSTIATAPNYLACPEPRGTQAPLQARGVDGVRPPAMAQPLLARPDSSVPLRGPACLLEVQGAGQATMFLEPGWINGEEVALV